MKPENYVLIADRMLKQASVNNLDDTSARIATSRVMRLGCVALQEFLKDIEEPNGDLYWAWQHLKSLNQEELLEQQDRRRALGQVLDTFLVAEENVFKAYGMPDQLKAYIINMARDLLSDIEQMDRYEMPSIRRIQQNVSELKDEICEHSRVLGSSEGKRKLLRNGAYVLSGGAVVGMNASADAITTFGLLPWMTVVSGVLGDKLIEKGIS